jgi:hypothetical protein
MPDGSSSPPWRGRGARAYELRCCHEAGPCGFELHRHLTGMGIVCEVAAPSLIPALVGEAGPCAGSGRRPPFKAGVPLQILPDQGSQFPQLRLPDSEGGLNSLPVS